MMNFRKKKLLNHLKIMINCKKKVANNQYKIVFKQKKILYNLKIMINLKKNKVLMNYKMILKIKIYAFKNMKK